MPSKFKLCRFQSGPKNHIQVGLVSEDQTILDLSAGGRGSISALLEYPEVLDILASEAQRDLPRFPLAESRLLAPIERQEVWAAGVTYQRSKTARMEESDFSATAYDRVYEAARPELFFKSLADKVAGPNEPVGIRGDSRWSVPEPEFALVINSQGRVTGYTIGNDMSSRDIEGENLLYLPQAKIYNGSCALGPWLVLGPTEAEVRSWSIHIAIQRKGETVFSGQTSIGQIKRSFAELVNYWCRCQTFTHGAILLTGTGVVPPDTFTLQPGDHIKIEIPEIGILENPVTRVEPILYKSIR